jgi:hypothetical protein
MEGHDLADVMAPDEDRGAQPAIVIVFEPGLLPPDRVNEMIGQVRQRNVAFVGVVSAAERRLPASLLAVLLRIGAPLHIFPIKLYGDLRAALQDRDRDNIIVLGHSRDPRRDLAAYLDQALALRLH